MSENNSQDVINLYDSDCEEEGEENGYTSDTTSVVNSNNQLEDGEEAYTSDVNGNSNNDTRSGYDSPLDMDMDMSGVVPPQAKAP